MYYFVNQMKLIIMKNTLIFILLISIVVPVWADESLMLKSGHAPCEINIPSGWNENTESDNPILLKAFSPNVPPSSISFVVRPLSEITSAAREVTVGMYADKYVEMLKKDFRAQMMEVKDLTIADYPAKSITDRHFVKAGNSTREVYSQTIIFFAGEHVYNFTLMTFYKSRKDAFSEFEQIVGSFHFLETEAAGEAADYTTTGTTNDVTSEAASYTTSDTIK